jgi:AAHS family 4-hydroxybenzoate transporter-like MFS transporter
VRLPESVRFLTLHGHADERVEEILSSIAASTRFPPGTRFGVNEEKAGGLPVMHLFRDGRGWATVLFWLVFFMSLLDLYLLSNWLPTVLNDLGASISAAAAMGAMLQVGGVAGAFTLGQFIDRFSFRALALIYFLAAFSVAAIGYSGRSIPLVTLAVFLAGFCVIGGQTASNALTATYYPTMARSTGVGWALGIGRLGSIVGPLLGGLMLSRHVGADILFLAAAVPALCACVAAFLLNKVALPVAENAAASAGGKSASDRRSWIVQNLQK